MKIAIISATYDGAVLAKRTAQELAGLQVTTYAKQGYKTGNATEYNSLCELVDSIFHQVDGFLFIMAAGIAVRVIAKHIKDKRIDPAVLVMDDKGTHVISLLSGHIGGANRLARQIALVTGAVPVITTATDVSGRLAPDEAAAQLNMSIYPFENLKAVNAALAGGKRVFYFLDMTVPQAEQIQNFLASKGTLLPVEKIADTSSYDAAVIISTQEFSLAKPYIYLRPPGLSIGIGCRRGTAQEVIREAIEDACRSIGKDMKDITVLASVDVKNNESGLLAVAQELGVPLAFYTPTELRKCIEANELGISPFVEKEIGVGNVCEAAALLASRSKVLWKKKTTYNKVTVAIAPVHYRLWA